MAKLVVFTCKCIINFKITPSKYFSKIFHVFFNIFFIWEYRNLWPFKLWAKWKIMLCFEKEICNLTQGLRNIAANFALRRPCFILEGTHLYIPTFSSLVRLKITCSNGGNESPPRTLNFNLFQKPATLWDIFYIMFLKI